MKLTPLEVASLARTDDIEGVTFLNARNRGITEVRGGLHRDYTGQIVLRVFCRSQGTNIT
jgi:hypothetical protein